MNSQAPFSWVARPNPYYQLLHSPRHPSFDLFYFLMIEQKPESQPGRHLKVFGGRSAAS